jgi:hypothetical protein
MFYGINGPPGIGNTYTAQPFLPFLDNDRGAEYLDGGRFISAFSRDWNNPNLPTLLTPGLIMGKISAAVGNIPATDVGNYAPMILGVTTANTTNGGTTVTVSAAQAAALVARVGGSGTNTISIVGPPTAGGTVAQQTLTYSAVNTTTGVITVSATSAAYVTGSIIVGTDGTQLPKGLLGGVEYGLPVVDPAGNAVTAQMPRLHVAGQIVGARVPGLLSGDASTITYVKGLLNASGRHFIFTEEY